ncbi:hypothetical protein Tco_0707943 [Tanacetum coccineum]
MNENMETEGLGCNLEEEMETQNSCEDCQNVKEASSSNVSQHKLTHDKHTIDSNGKQNCKNVENNEESNSYWYRYLLKNKNEAKTRQNREWN